MFFVNVILYSKVFRKQVSGELTELFSAFVDHNFGQKTKKILVFKANQVC